MAFAVAFLLVALVFAAYAVTLGGWWWALLWPTVSFAVVATGYAGLGARVFGKRADGTHRPLHLVLLLPFLAVSALAWHLHRVIRRGQAWHEFSPGLFAGRRVFAHELPSGIDFIIDLTSEFRPPYGIRTARKYLFAPILDAEAPPDEVLRDVVAQIMNYPGRVYIHCAQGHGRTGLLAAAILLARGSASNAPEALAAVKTIRTGVDLRPCQLRALERFAESCKQNERREIPPS